MIRGGGNPHHREPDQLRIISISSDFYPSSLSLDSAEEVLSPPLGTENLTRRPRIQDVLPYKRSGMIATSARLLNHDCVVRVVAGLDFYS